MAEERTRHNDSKAVIRAQTQKLRRIRRNLERLAADDPSFAAAIEPMMAREFGQKEAA